MKQILPVGIVLVSFFLPLKSIAQNTSPNAVNDYVEVCQNSGTVNIVVQSNDSDPENNALTTSINSGPWHGTGSLAGNTINYTPDLNYSGGDTIVYVICDNGSPSLCDTALVIINVRPMPIADAGSDQTICLHDSIQIGTPGAMNVSYAWSPPSGLSNANVPQPYASPSSTTSYTIVATNNTSGCQNRDTVTITINPVPPADAGQGVVACQFDSVQLGTPPTPGNTYYWTPIPPLSWNNDPQPYASPTVTTTFTLIVTTTATGCQSMDSVTIVINPAPPTNAGPDRYVCNGDSVVIGTPAVAGVTYSWAPATGLSATNIAQPTASPTVTTSYTLTVTNSTTGCHDTSVVVVHVGSGPVANAGPDQTACDGDSVMIGTPSVPFASYSWAPATGLSATNIAQPMASPSSTTTYTLTVTSGSCTSSDVVTVTIGTSPNADAGPDQEICAGSTVQIGTPATSGNTYSWSPTNGLSSSSAAQPNASPTVTTVYILTVTSPTGCSDYDTVMVEVHPLPVANAGPDQTSCNLDSVQVGMPGTPGNTYTWSPILGLSNPNIAQPWAAPLVTTSYTLTVTNTATGCTNSDVVVINVGSAPQVSAGPDQSICAGDSTQIGLPAIPGNTYSWTPTAGLSNPNIAQPWASPSATTTYYVVLTNSSSGCQTNDSVTITVNPNPVANAGPDVVSCGGDSVQIGSPAAAGNLYVWLPPLGLSNPAIAQPMAAPLTTTTYTLTVTNPLTGCMSTDTVVVSTGTTPVADAGADQSVCFGDSVMIGTAAVNGNTYAWSPSAGLSATNIAQPSTSPSSSMSYTLTVTNAAGCSATDSVMITVNPLPVAAAGSDQTICAGDSATIGTPGNSGYTYLWQPTATLDSAMIAQPVATPTTTTTYTVQVKDDATGCIASDSVTVFVNPQPVANAGADVSICANDSVQIGSSASSGMTYSWSPSMGLSATNIAQPYAHPSSTTSYTLTVTNGNNCSQTDVVVVTIAPAPVADAGNGSFVCNGDSLLIGTPATPGVTYSWSPSDGLSSTTDAQVNASPSVTTTYTLTVSNGTCSDTSLVTVGINSPIADAGPDRVSCADAGAQLGTVAVSGYVYLWSPSSGLSDPTVAQPTVSGGTTTTYTLEVTDTLTGCVARDEVVCTIGEGNVYNSFSPNGDGSNDYWKVPVLDCFNENTVTIVNRWGSEVWKGQNYNNTDIVWNGKNKDNVDVPDGTYFYIIQYNDQELRGWVFLKR